MKLFNANKSALPNKPEKVSDRAKQGDPNYLRKRDLVTERFFATKSIYENTTAHESTTVVFEDNVDAEINKPVVAEVPVVAAEEINTDKKTEVSSSSCVMS